MLSGALAGTTARDDAWEAAALRAPGALRFARGGTHEVAAVAAAALCADRGARAIAEPNGRILWLSAPASTLIERSATLGVIGGMLIGRTRHSADLLSALLAGARSAGAQVDQLFARATNDDPELLVQARSGEDPSMIALTIRSLTKGQPLQQFPDLTRLYALTQSEEQIARLMIEGQSATDIAAALNKSVLTVRTHVKHIYQKLNVGNKEQMFALFIRLMVD